MFSSIIALTILGPNLNLILNGYHIYVVAIITGIILMKKQTNSNYPAAVMLITAILSVSSCGGGSSSSSDPAGETPAVTTYTVGGTLTGLATGASISLSNNGGNTLTLTADGSFTFNTPLADNANYTVSIAAQPMSPYQTCTLSGDSGVISGDNVQAVTVVCTTNSYTVSGYVSGSGLSGSGNSVTLQNNAGDDVTLTANGIFSFPAALSGTTYSVSVSAQSTFPSQTCTVTGGSGTLEGGDVTGVSVECIRDSFTVSGTLTALAVGASVTLQNNGGDNLVLTSDGNFSFPVAIADGGTYNVTVLTQPSSTVQNCGVSNASGTFSSSNVNDVLVVCVTDTFVNGFVDSGQLIAQAATGGVGTMEVTRGVAVGDIDGDSDLDLIAVGRLGQDGETYLNDGNGVFTSSQVLNATLSVTRTIKAVAMGDIDGDNDLDVVLVGSGSDGGTLVYTNSSGTLTDSAQALGTTFDSSAIALGDIDGDGDLDIVVGNAFNSYTTNATTPNRVYTNDGSGVFSDSGQALGLSNTRAVALGDLNGDGDLDLVVGNAGMANWVYFNNGSGTFTESAVNSVLAAESAFTSSLALGDVDADGDLDLVVGNLNAVSKIYLNDNNTGIFVESPQVLAFGSTTSVILADLDGDTDLDLVLGNSDASSLIYINDGTGAFTEHATSSALGSFNLQAMAIGDLDGDNDPDLVTGNGENNISDPGKDRVFLNQTN